MVYKRIFSILSFVFIIFACDKHEIPLESKSGDTIIQANLARIDSSFNDTVVITITEDTTYVDMIP